MMARDVGMRTIYCAHHRLLRPGLTEHRLFGPEKATSQQRRFVDAGDRWPAVAADLVMRFPADSVSVAATHSSIGDARHHMVQDDTLLSWVIGAPVRLNSSVFLNTGVRT
jgi:hypothetical protein